MAGVYPYVLTYVPEASEQIVLQINVPIEVAAPLQLGYSLQLLREVSTAGWHENVPLNDSAIIDYVDSDQNEGYAVLPVPSTRYFVPFKVIYDEQYDNAFGHVYYQGAGPVWLTRFDGVPYLLVDEAQTIPNPAVTRDGYTFLGWATDPAGEFMWDFTSEVTEDMTLYAQWKRDEIPPTTTAPPTTTVPPTTTAPPTTAPPTTAIPTSTPTVISTTGGYVSGGALGAWVFAGLIVAAGGSMVGVAKVKRR